MQARKSPKATHKRIAKGIYKRVSSAGQTYYLVYGGKNRSGKIEWYTYDTEDEARARRKQAKNAVSNQGNSLFDLTPEQRREADECYKKLKPLGISLSTAVDCYLQKVWKFQESPTVKQAVDKLVARLQKNRRRDRAVQDAKNRLTKFALSFSERKLTDITSEEIAGWLDSIGGMSGTQVNYRKRLNQLWRFALRNRWCADNPVAVLEPISVERSETKAFTVEECLRLLQAADSFGLLPYISLGLFAGLRPEETEKLSWDAVKLDRNSVIIDERVAKKRSRRVVTVTEALAGWITPHVQSVGAVTPLKSPSLRWRLELLKKAAAIDTWHHDGLRHTYGSFHLELHKNAALTATEMGNSEDVVHRHYKALVDPADVPRFWGLRPNQQISSPTTAR